MVVDRGNTAIEVLMRVPGLAAEPRRNHGRPLVPFSALQDAAPTFISGWFELYDRLGPAMLFFIAALSERMFLENRLLNDTSFAASYHRILHDEPPIAAEEHAGYVAAMLKTIGNTGPAITTRRGFGSRLPRSAAATEMADQARERDVAETRRPESRAR
jgi:hypothetical protein